MEERVSLTVTKYLTPEGNQTCVLNFETGEVCTFYRTQRFGTHESCLLSETGSRGFGMMLKRDVSTKGVPGEGFLIPDDHCPIKRGTVDPPKIFKLGDRVMVFDPLLYVNDTLTPLSVTMQPAMVIRGNYINDDFFPTEDLIDVRFYRKDRKIKESCGHFAWSVRIIK